jgi:hypothetical protein
VAYLTTEAGLDQAKAKEVLKQVDQTDELLAGNQVWFFYDPKGDTFRTYVTAGTAGQTPIAMRRAKTRELIKQRDAFKKERDTANEQVATLGQEKSQLEEELLTKQNSLFYHADSDQSLKDQGVLTSVRKRLQDVKNVSYEQALDLRLATSITLDPSNFGLQQIRGVRLLPEIYQEGRDYSIEIQEDKSAARLVILDPEVFKGKEVLLAVRG